MKKTKQKFLEVIGGIFTGFANGFFGGGGGMISVPFMTYALKKEPKKSHATTMLVILPITVFSASTYILKGSIDWSITWQTAVGVLLGGVVGALILKKIPNKILTYVFGLVMIVAGVRMCF